jgi:hypothetical protein
VSGGGAITAAEMVDWLRRVTPSLLAQRVNAVHGQGPRLTTDGASWISFSSNLGTGRLVRAADGSSTAYVRRHRDGVRILDHQADTTTEAHLDGLVTALSAGT